VSPAAASGVAPIATEEHLEEEEELEEDNSNQKNGNLQTSKNCIFSKWRVRPFFSMKHTY
jgi:hypothetical protein